MSSGIEKRRKHFLVREHTYTHTHTHTHTQVGKKTLEDFDAKRKVDVQKAQAKNKTEETVLFLTGIISSYTCEILRNIACGKHLKG
jgi:hypothetical protein